MSQDFELQVDCEADPSAILRVMEYFSARNIIPLVFKAELIATDRLAIYMRVRAVKAHIMTVIAARIRQMAFVRSVTATPVEIGAAATS